jgi:hypothetical protein
MTIIKKMMDSRICPNCKSNGVLEYPSMFQRETVYYIYTNITPHGVRKLIDRRTLQILCLQILAFQI